MQNPIFAMGISMPVRLLLFILFLLPLSATAQTFATTRTSSGLIAYDIVLGTLTSPSVTTSALYGSVTDTAFVTDASHTNAATLTARCFNIVLAGFAGESWLQAKFPTALSSGRTAYFRVDLPTSSGLAVDVLTTVGDLTKLFSNNLIIVSAYSGASTSDTGTRISSAKVRKALVRDTAGNYYIAVTADSSFNAARIGLRFNTGLLGVSFGASLSMKVYYGVEYTIAECNGRPAYTDLGTSSGLTVLLLDSVVNNPVQAIDSSLSTYSRLGGTGLATVGIASTMAQTFYFKSTDPSCDQVRVVMSTPGTVLDLSLANSIEIAAFRRDTLVSEQSLDNLLSPDFLTLFSTDSGVVVYMDPGGVFDKVRITYRHDIGVRLIDSGLSIYDIAAAPAKPVLSTDTTTIYVYTTPLISATASAGNEVKWYNPAHSDLSTGPLFPSTDTISTSALYYAKSSRIPCANLSDTAKFWLKVVPLIFTDPVVGTQGTPYTGSAVTLPGAGISGAGFRYTLEAGSSLPPGLILNSNGTISGVSSVTDTMSFVALLFDSVNNLDAGRHTFNLIIRSALDLPPMMLAAGTAFVPYSVILPSATGGTGNYTYALSASTPLPSGMSYDSTTGLLSGTVATGSYSFLINVTDDEGRTDSQTYSLDIAAPLSILLNSFTGEQKGQTNILRWQTASEEQIQALQLQSSEDGIIWKPIYQCTLRHVANVDEYSYEHCVTYSGRVLYRLEVTVNDKRSYSEVLHFFMRNRGSVVPAYVFPNPVSSGSQLSIVPGNRSGTVRFVTIYDGRGGLLYKGNKCDLLHLRGVDQGLHILCLEYEDGSMEQVKLLIR